MPVSVDLHMKSVPHSATSTMLTTFASTTPRQSGVFGKVMRECEEGGCEAGVSYIFGEYLSLENHSALTSACASLAGYACFEEARKHMKYGGVGRRVLDGHRHHDAVIAVVT